MSVRDHRPRSVFDDDHFKSGRQHRKEIVRLGAFLRSLREKRKLTQNDIAERGHFTQPEICRIEAGNAENGPEYGTILRYLAACGVAVSLTSSDRTDADIVTFDPDNHRPSSRPRLRIVGKR
jgi:transcriptional regulator with XRE-family HTH domain